MGKRVLVYGSFVVDLTSRSNGLPVPGQTVLGKSFQLGPGGKGSNQAVAAHRAGADVTLVTKLGDDVFAKVALDFYEQEGMDVSHILIGRNMETGAALIMVDEESGQNEIVVVSGACGQITSRDVEKARPLIESADFLLLQLEINFDALLAVLRIAHKAGVQTILNPAPAADLPEEMLRMVHIVTPNETEAQALTGVAVANKADAQKAAERFFRKGVKNVIITLGASGAFATDGIQSELLPRVPVEAVDATGAGDAFNGGLVMALAEGRDLFTALRYGNVTGALSATKPGTAPSMPSRPQIDALYQETYGKLD
ncbi:MAG: ribokinase [Clostridia bacterium]|nr:ribokinase [Clostridia bacterium]